MRPILARCSDYDHQSGLLSYAARGVPWRGSAIVAKAEAIPLIADAPGSP